jgi:hypothetical protein
MAKCVYLQSFGIDPDPAADRQTRLALANFLSFTSSGITSMFYPRHIGHFGPP